MSADRLGVRYLAPAAAPIRVPDLARWAALALAGGAVSDRLRHELAERFDVRHAFLTSTGRAGMTLLLRAMRRLAPLDRDEVVVPSYTCYSVAASVVKAGLRPRIVDIDPETLDYAYDELSRTDLTRVLAIVATNLYGLPNDLPALARLARDRGVFLIDDAAQAMGARVGGRWSGTWGDAGLFSFDKGKNVSAIDGGVVVVQSDDLAEAVRREMSDVPSPGALAAVSSTAKALGYFAMLRPWLYWVPNGIPQLGLGRTVFTTDFPIERPSRSLTSLAVAMLPRLDSFTEARVRNAGALLSSLREVPGVRTIPAARDTTPVFLRLPILITDDRHRRRALEALRAAGIGATGSYPASLADVPELHRHTAGALVRARGGRTVARQIVTLPTHALVGPADVARMVDIVRMEALGTAAPMIGMVSAR